MPSGRRATDVSWQYLRLIKSERPQKGLIGSRNLQLRYTHAQSFPTRLRISPRSLPQPVNCQIQHYAHWKSLLVGQHVRNQEHVRDQARTRDLDIQSAYQELRKLSLKGDFINIKNCVNILVKERGQKPNLRLYDALLLANTDSQYGSAGEVARILDEIAAEGLAPDSATYHAALRVGDGARKVRMCFGLHPTGSCNTSRLSVEATLARRSTPTMVLFDQRRLARRGRGSHQRATSRACT